MVSILHRSQHDFAVARCHGPQGSWWETVSRTWVSHHVFPVSLFHSQVVEADHRSDELEFMNTLKGMTELKVWSRMKLWLGISWQLCLLSQHMFSSWCIEDPFMIKHDKPKVGSILCRESNLIQTPNIFILAAQTVPQIFVDGKIIPGWDLRCQRCQWCHALCEYWVSPDKKQKTTTSPRR